MTAHLFTPLVEVDPFDLSNEYATGPTDYAASQLPQELGDTGSLLEDYHFRTGFTELESSDHLEVPQVLDRLNRVKDKIIFAAEQNGISSNLVTYALNESIQNATKYGGAVTPGDPKLIHIGWNIERSGSARGMTVSIGNPARELFDPARYLMMKRDEVDKLRENEETVCGHLGLLYIMGASARCDYAWHLPDGGEIHLSMLPVPPEEVVASPELTDLNFPVHRKATLIDSNGNCLPYSIEQFLKDVEDARAASSVVLKFFIPFGNQEMAA